MLRGEHEVDAQRPPPRGDVDEAVDEVGYLVHELSELVDAQHQAREGVQPGDARVAPAPVVVQVRAPGPGEHRLPAAQLRAQ